MFQRTQPKSKSLEEIYKFEARGGRSWSGRVETWLREIEEDDAKQG